MKRYLEEFCVSFQETHKLPLCLHGTVPVYEGWAKLRSFTLSIDIASLLADYEPEDEYKWSRTQECFDRTDSHIGFMWRQLLYLPFNKVTLLVTNTSTDAQVPPDTSALAKFLRSTLSSLAETIGYNYQSHLVALDHHAAMDYEYGEPRPHQIDRYGEYDPTPKRAWYTSAEEFRFARVQYERICDRSHSKWVHKQWIRGDDQVLHAPRIKTKELCFAWDVRGADAMSNAHGKLKLVGKKYMYTLERAEKLWAKDELRKRRYENLWPH